LGAPGSFKRLLGVRSSRILSRHQDEVSTLGPSNVSPESQRLSIVCTDHEVALVNAFRAEGRQHALCKGPTKPKIAMTGRNCEVVKVAAAAVVPPQDGGDQSALIPSNEAEAGIALQVIQDRLARVSRSKGKAFRPLP